MDWQQLMQAVGPYLGAMPSQAAPTPGQGAMAGPANPQAQPKMQYGMGDVLGSPALQGAMDAYFGYLARPRGPYTNRWQGLGMAGLAGLGGFQQARSTQLEAPMRAAELQKTQAEAAKTGMETQDLQQQMQMRKAMLDQFDKSPAAQKMDPLQRMGARQAILEGKATPETFGIMSPYQKGELAMRDKDYQEKVRKDTADIKKGQIEASQRGEEIGLRRQAVGIEGGNLAERQVMDKWRKGQVAGTAMTPAALTKIDKTAHDLGVKDAGPAPKPPTGLGTFVGRHSGYDAAATKDYQDQLQRWRQDVQVFTAQHKAELTNEATAGAAATRSAAMSGGDEEGGSGLRLGATVTAPDGTVHRYKGGPTDDPSSYEPVAP